MTTDAMTATIEAKKKEAPKELPQPPAASDNVPSGFILKLFQMVNGAPDEVIRWTEEGDAFVIGSDVERLESETLPQYFRHNRFQSLVRQLNFYSFRKINRERNVWIYKHNLFHRDHPEDLYMVRRRTCPGLDGRKQRFSSRAAIPKPGSKKSEDAENGIAATTTNSDEESGSMVDEQHQVIVESPSNDSSMSGGAKKRDSLTSRRASMVSLATLDQPEADIQQPKPKRSRYQQETPDPTPQAPDSPVVDTSILQSLANGATAAGDEDMPDDSSLDNKRNEKLEMLEQSMIVNDVALKLEEYAKRARKNGMLPARVRRPGAGVVTPPFSSSSYQASMSASELLTYDDEYPTEDLKGTDLFGIHSASSVVTDSDLDEVEDERMYESKLPKELLVAPVPIPQAKSITERLLMSDVTSAAVAGFCMSTAPHGNPEMSRKILQLIASCEVLAFDFHQYREALKPMVHSGDPNRNPVTLPHHARMNHVQNWEREGSRSDAVRDFKIFSVNCVRKILGGSSGPLADADRVALKHTADIWLKSISIQTRRELQ